ncbi:MarR family winged helix-turn-helix transcriptional regulator [Testudinibacter sp. P27/CKL/0425]
MSSENHAQYLIWQLKNLTLSMNKALDQRLQQEELTLSQARVLLLLFAENGQNQSSLMKQLQIESSSMTKIIDLLERKNFIVRKDNHRDARRKNIFLTKQGQHKENAIHQLLQQFEADLLSPLSAAEAQQLVQLLQKIQPETN